MKKTFTILLASAALTTFVGLPALAAINASDGTGSHARTAAFERLADGPRTMQVADSDEHDGAWGHDEHDDDDDRDYGHDDDDDCEDDDHMATCASGTNPAPAGTTAPPQNGLFANGASPAVQVN